MAPHSSTLAWKIPWTEEPGRLQSIGSLRVGHDWATSLSLFTFMLWRRRWQPTPVFLPGESQGWGSLVGCRLWGHTESDTTEVTSQQQPKRTEIILFLRIKGNVKSYPSATCKCNHKVDAPSEEPWAPEMTLLLDEGGSVVGGDCSLTAICRAISRRYFQQNNSNNKNPCSTLIPFPHFSEGRNYWSKGQILFRLLLH